MRNLALSWQLCVHCRARVITGSIFLQGHLGGVIGGREKAGRIKEEAGRGEGGSRWGGTPMGGCC